MQRGLIILIINILIVSVSYAQRFGGNPPSLKWRQIDTDTVRVIFPEGLDSTASRIATLSHLLNRTTGATIGDQSRRINIVLQKGTTVSNAYVGLAPWRSEFQLTPQQNSLSLGSLPWVDNLAIHEYRHVQQFMNFRKGLSKLGWVIAGEEGQAVLNGAAIPDWFFEGDAVFQETIVSRQGRGRLPEFFNGYRSLWQAGKDYSYMKLRNGSLKDYVPDHYQLGYLLVAYGNAKYGPEFWKNVTDHAARYRSLFYPFQHGVKKFTGKKYSAFVEETFSAFRSEHKQEENNSQELLTAINKRYVNEYHFPFYLGHDSILVLKRSFRHNPAWYIISNGRERRITVKDIGPDDYFSYKNGKIVYSTYYPHSRWTWQDYTGINMIDIATGMRTRIRTRSKYFSPDISHDGSVISAVDVEPGGRSSIHLLDAVSGELIRDLPNPDNYFITYPVFSQNDKEVICAVRNTKGEMSLMAFHTVSGEKRILLPFSYYVIAFPRVRGDRIIFTASHNRRDEVWIWDDRHQTLQQTVSRYTGSYGADISPDGRYVLYSGFNAEGMHLFREEIRPSGPVTREDWAKASNVVYMEDALDKSTPLNIVSIADQRFAVKRYKGGGKLFNVHSWRPYYEQPDWSFTLYSENILNNFRSDLYYNYNENEGFHKIGFNGNLAIWYPWITGGVSQTFDRNYADTSRDFRWNEFNANIGLRLPLNFSGGLFYKYLTLSSTFNTQQLYYKQNSNPKPVNSGIQYLSNVISWTIQNQQARQHIYPRLAHALLLQYRTAVGNNEARQFLASTSLYLPGIFSSNSLVLNGAYQARDTMGQYLFSNSFPIARGYPGFDFPRMWKLGANYHFPIVYPDWGFAQLVYFRRIRANLFYDYAWIKSLRSNTVRGLRSAGVELYFDTRWWNQQSVSFGVRYSRLLDNDIFVNPLSANQWEFIMPVDLIRR